MLSQPLMFSATPAEWRHQDTLREHLNELAEHLKGCTLILAQKRANQAAERWNRWRSTLPAHERAMIELKSNNIGNTTLIFWVLEALRFDHQPLLDTLLMHPDFLKHLGHHRDPRYSRADFLVEALEALPRQDLTGSRHDLGTCPVSLYQRLVDHGHVFSYFHQCPNEISRRIESEARERQLSVAWHDESESNTFLAPSSSPRF